MRCLITGAAGFVGTNLAIRLLNKGHEVIGTDSLCRKGSEKNLAHLQMEFPNFKFAPLDIAEMPDFIRQQEPDVVYHFAAQVAVTNSETNPEEDFEINARGTFRVALAAHQVGAPVIYTSTNKVFGDNVNGVPLRELATRYDFDGELKQKGIPETFPIDAKHHSKYGVSKLTGDQYVREFGGIVNRCSCMYGRYQYGISDQGWLSYFATQKILGKPVTIYGDGKQVRDAVHANDVVRLLEKQGDLVLAGRQDILGEVFNVGGGYHNTISLRELCDTWDIRNPSFADWRPADQKVFYCDISKAERVLGWRPEISLKKGLEDLYQWTEKSLST